MRQVKRWWIVGTALLLTGCMDAYEERGLCSYLGGCMETAEDCDDGDCSDAAMTEAIIKSRRPTTIDDTTH